MKWSWFKVPVKVEQINYDVFYASSTVFYNAVYQLKAWKMHLVQRREIIIQLLQLQIEEVYAVDCEKFNKLTLKTAKNSCETSDFLDI